MFEKPHCTPLRCWSKKLGLKRENYWPACRNKKKIDCVRRTNYFASKKASANIISASFCGTIFPCLFDLWTHECQGKRKRKRQEVGFYCEEGKEDETDVSLLKTPWRMPVHLSPGSQWGEYYAKNQFLMYVFLSRLDKQLAVGRDRIKLSNDKQIMFLCVRRLTWCYNDKQ